MLRPVLLCLLIMVGHAVNASPVNSALPDAELRGEATLRFLGFPLYKARLFTPSGARLDWNKDFALELTYLRNLTAYDLVEGTMREFARTGGTLPVRAQLNQCFFDVRKGDRYTAVSDVPNTLTFWRNDTRTCTLSHPQIKARFMGIFLGDNTRSRRFTSLLRSD
ncbi:chalcone isomerase family protein [Aliiroseovarius marinus]|uniref:chalcone isomerase family protein n=1 Tax=Aliiroseovarius marinus TaxID=2500159 RepID=UPI001F1110CF|nr:chalcone isomerase family protein [Aliiroseovarius marinus]